MQLALPMKQNSSSGGGGVTVMNSSTYYDKNYPDLEWKGMTFVPFQGAIELAVNAFTSNVTYTPADFPILENVGGTQINGYNKKIAKEFTVLGDYYVNQSFGTSNFLRVGRQTSSSTANGTYTAIGTVRICSLEELKAGYNIGANVNMAPAIAFKRGGYSGTTILTNVFAVYSFKLLRSNGTLVNIGSYTTATYGTTLGAQSPGVITNIALEGLKKLSFTPVTSQLGDRIVVDIQINGTMQITASGNGSSAQSCGFMVVGGFNGSNLGFVDNADAFRPIQISIV